MQSIEHDIRAARERYNSYVADATARRRVADSLPRRSLPRRAAWPLGRVLLRAGAWLLRYSDVEGAPAARLGKRGAQEGGLSL